MVRREQRYGNRSLNAEHWCKYSANFTPSPKPSPRKDCKLLILLYNFKRASFPLNSYVVITLNKISSLTTPNSTCVTNV